MADIAPPDTPFDIARANVLGGVPHGFFGSGASVSDGVSDGGAHQFGYGGPGDPAEVARLRAAAAHAVQESARIVMPHQVHSPDVVTVEEPWEDVPTGRPVADAVVTNRSGLALGIVTADCGPVLFADREAAVVGAAHAGWRGAHGGVIENTIAAMEALGADRTRIATAIGPTIAQPSYEVDAPFRDNFTSTDEAHFAPADERNGTPRWHFDLPGYIEMRLKRAGVASVTNLALDTYSLPDRYHSYRRASQQKLPNYGRQISIIALP